MAITLTNAHLRHSAMQLGSNGGSSTGVKVILYENNITPSKNSVLSDFDLAGTSREPEGNEVGAPYQSGGWWVQDYSLDLGSVSGPTGGTTVYGFIVVDDRGGSNELLIHAHRFASPINVPEGAEKAFTLEIRTKARQV